MSLSVLVLSLVSAASFALALVLAPFGLRSLGPLTGGSVSVPTAAALFVAISPFTVDWNAWDPHGAAIFAATGLFFPAAVTLLSFASNRQIGPNLTGALGNLSPVFAIALAVVVLGDVPRPWQIVGVAAVCGGLAVVASERSRADPAAARWLLLLPVAAAVVRGATQPMVKLGLDAWPNPFAAATIGYFVSASVILLASRGAGFRRRNRSAAGIAWFAAVGLCNGTAVLALYAALARGPVAVVAPIVGGFPLLTIALNRAIHRDRTLSPKAAAGIAVSVAGIALVLGT